MTEIPPAQYKTSTYISKKKKFQNDPNDPDIILVPKEQLPNPVLEMEVQKIKKKINLTEAQRLKRQEQGKKLGEMSKQRALERKERKEKEAEVLLELEQRRKEEESKKLQDEINQKIQDGKLVRVKVKPALTRKKTVTAVTKPEPIESKVVIETETETDTDHEEERKKQRKKRKEAVKLVETLKTIDETIQKVTKGKYFDQLNASWL